MFTPTRACFSAWLTTLGAGGGGDTVDLGDATLALFKTAIVPTVDTVWGDLTEADYEGYARTQLGTMSAPFVGPQSLSLTQATLIEFRPTGDDTPNTIFGSALVMGDASAPLLLGCEVFDEPIPLDGPSSLLTVVPRYGFDPAGNFGLSIVAG